MMRYGIAIALLALTTTASAQTTPLARWTVTGAANKGCDGGTWGAGPREGSWYRFDVVAGGSPTGTDSLRITALPTAEVGDVGWGCRFGGEAQAVPATSAGTRYVRYRAFFETPYMPQSDNRLGSVAVNNRTVMDKFFIVGDLSNDNSRIIGNFYAEPPGRTQVLFQPSVGTPSSNPADFYFGRPGVWLNVQVRITPGPQGRIETWVNTDDVNAPTLRGPVQSIGTRGWSRATCANCGGVGFGDHSWNALSNRNPNARLVYQIADMEYDDEFDPRWTAKATGGGGPIPVDCAGTWGAWTRQQGSETACVNGSRTFIESHLFTVTTPPTPGGTACPASPESRTAAEACTMPPPPPPVDTCVSAPLVVTSIAWPGSAEGARSGRFTWSVAGLVVTLQSVEFVWHPQQLRIADSRGCSVTITR